MRETQRTVGDWIHGTFPGTDPESPRKALRALEEMIELCLASGATAEDIELAVGRAFMAACKGTDCQFDAPNKQPEKNPC